MLCDLVKMCTSMLDYLKVYFLYSYIFMFSNLTLIIPCIYHFIILQLFISPLNSQKYNKQGQKYIMVNHYLYVTF